MANHKRCNNLNAHEYHEWSEELMMPDFSRPNDLRPVIEHHWCEGWSPEESHEGKMKTLGFAEFRNLKELKFTFDTREGVPTEITLADLLPGDGAAKVSVIDSELDGWACVEIRVLARKPYIAREVED